MCVESIRFRSTFSFPAFFFFGSNIDHHGDLFLVSDTLRSSCVRSMSILTIGSAATTVVRFPSADLLALACLNADARPTVEILPTAVMPVSLQAARKPSSVPHISRPGRKLRKSAGQRTLTPSARDSKNRRASANHADLRSRQKTPSRGPGWWYAIRSRVAESCVRPSDGHLCHSPSTGEAWYHTHRGHGSPLIFHTPYFHSPG